MQQKNAEKLKTMEAEIVDAEQNLGMDEKENDVEKRRVDRRERSATGVAEEVGVPVPDWRQGRRCHVHQDYLREDREWTNRNDRKHNRSMLTSRGESFL